MLHCEVQLQQTHFLLKETSVVVRRSVGGTDGLLVRWATVYTHTAGIEWSESLADSMIITEYVYTGIQVCIQQKMPSLCIRNIQ